MFSREQYEQLRSLLRPAARLAGPGRRGRRPRGWRAVIDVLAAARRVRGVSLRSGKLGVMIAYGLRPSLIQTLADSVRVLGADHPQTKIVRGNLAAVRQHPQ